MRLQTYVNEGGYSRMMQSITGLVPSVKTFAIITWENPINNVGDGNFNKEANSALKSLLKSSYYSYRQIKGKYDRIENPFLIMNIKVSQAKHIGFEYEKYKQESIIYGQRIKNGVIFKMIYHDNRNPDIRRIWTSDSNDMYSEYKGRKFIIPFFDDEYKHYMFKKGKKSVIEDHNIYHTKDVSDYTVRILNSMRDESLDEGLNGYIHRGRINIELHKIGARN